MADSSLTTNRKAWARCIGPWPKCGHKADYCTAGPEYQGMIMEKQKYGVVIRSSYVTPGYDRNDRAEIRNYDHLKTFDSLEHFTRWVKENSEKQYGKETVVAYYELKALKITTRVEVNIA